VVDDLLRVLAYANAVDPAGVDATPVKVADDLVTVAWWTPEFCGALIRAAQAVGGFDTHPDDPVPGEEISLAAISPRLFEAVQHDVGVRLWPALRHQWPLIDYHGLRDAFIIRYEPARQTELRLHHDVAQVSASVKLNDDYTGGVLEFPRQQASNAELPVGSLLAWPSLVTHPHRSTPVTAGVKYSLTIWCELPEQYH
jgi:hypothetical protein